jgi:hypothetical protein
MIYSKKLKINFLIFILLIRFSLIYLSFNIFHFIFSAYKCLYKYLIQVLLQSIVISYLIFRSLFSGICQSAKPQAFCFVWVAFLFFFVWEIFVFINLVNFYSKKAATLFSLD